ncbi:MAG: hypothetical protein NTV63_02510 [Candidatus Woesearchaeota archaeon]|nr:hypothetical protein [Candidatus Woesearchaeota archaeon]
MEKNKGEKKEEKEEGKDVSQWEKMVTAKAIIEILGAPKDYIEKTIRMLIEDVEKVPEISVNSKEFFEAKPQDGLFSTFTEIEADFKDLSILFGFCIDFMPSTVEIIEPVEFSIEGREMTNSLNELIAKVHRMDMVLKNLNAENQLLQKNAALLLRNNVMINLKAGELPLSKLSPEVGVSEEQLKPFLDAMIESKFIEEKEGRYSLKK